MWIASLTGLLPRNEKETLRDAPDTFALGKGLLITCVASKKSTA